MLILIANFLLILGEDIMDQNILTTVQQYNQSKDQDAPGSEFSVLTGQFSARNADHTEILKSIANKKRLGILKTLHSGEKTVTGIQNILAAHMPLSQSSLSQHLNRMKEDGLLTARRDSRNIYYSIANTFPAMTAYFLLKFLNETEMRKDASLQGEIQDQEANQNKANKRAPFQEWRNTKQGHKKRA